MTGLTPRQREVAALVADAWTNKRIAAELGLSERRVQELIGIIAQRLGADADRDHRVQVAKLWVHSNAA